MSCFWIGILSALGLDTSNKYIQTFIYYIKKNNTKTPDVLWNDTALTEKQLDENFQAINELDETNFGNGYLCSTFEPVLFLVSHLFSRSIYHNYNGNILLYKNTMNPTMFIRFQNDSGHFWNT
jgi:hypothetical protein